MDGPFALQRYLDRIGISETSKPDLATLTALHVAHVAAIPFEGIDPFLGRPVSIELPALVDKLLDHRRGGYCFEQNALFQAVLVEIGFSVTALAGRVRWNSRPEEPLGPRTHMLLKVALAEGPYLADVGFGACVIDRPLRLEVGPEQPTAMGIYRLSKAGRLFTLSAKQPAGWRDMYVFDLEPQSPADYLVGNWFTSTNPRAPFPHVLIMERVTADRRYKLINLSLVTESRDGERISEEVIENAEALGRVLDEIFKVTPPLSVAEVFARARG